MQDLGKIKKLNISEIRVIWKNEEKDFSPWIEDNIDSLNDVLNLQIEIESIEEFVDNFRLDLAGTDNYSQVPVLIENQISKSDHDHLGKLLTYSAAKEAGIIIWIATEIQKAHREAIEWINKITPQDMIFYGIEIEVFRIDNSLPAPHFNIVAGPPPSKKRSIPTGEISPRNIAYQNFFEGLRKKLIQKQPSITKATALPQSYFAFTLGRSGFSLAIAFTIDNKIRVEIYIDTGSKEQNDNAFNRLEDEKNQIKKKIGAELFWDNLPDRRASRISISKNGTIDDNKEKLQELENWAIEYTLKFREVFAPLVKNIEL